jgi:hypothetical protein
MTGAGGDSGGGGVAGAGGEGGVADGSTTDGTGVDADATLADMAPPYSDAPSDRVLDADGRGSPGDAPYDTISPPDSTDAPPDAATDGSSGTDASDAALPPADTAADAPNAPDADAPNAPDADAGSFDANDGASTGIQILPRHGTPIFKPDAGAPFDSRCASDEVVTGFIARAGVQTDAIGSTCSKLNGTTLSSPHNLPLVGNATGGNAVTVACPANHAAVGIVGRFGHNTMWMEDVTTMIGVVCKNLTSTATQIVTITSQPALDSGYTSFREDCTAGRFLTDISGLPDSNSLGYTIGQVGGECSVR